MNYVRKAVAVAVAVAFFIKNCWRKVYHTMNLVNKKAGIVWNGTLCVGVGYLKMFGLNIFYCTCINMYKHSSKTISYPFLGSYHILQFITVTVCIIV